MANWQLYFGGGGIGFGGEIPSAFVDALDAWNLSTPNASAGSAHVASSPVSIGGCGIVCPGAFLADNATIIIPSYAAWATSTAYSAGNFRVANGNLYYCLIGGTSASTGSGPSASTTTPIVDGTVTWSYVSGYATYGLTIDGAGLLNGTLLVNGGGNLNVASGGTETIQSGGFLDIYGTANVESGGTLEVLSGGELDVQSGALLVVRSGGGLTIQGALTVISGATETVQSGGAIVLDSGAVQSVQSGGEILIQSGGLVDVDGTLKIESGGELEVKSGGLLQADAGSTVTLAGTNTMSGTLAQTGPRTKSTASGYDVGRVTTIVQTGGSHPIANPALYDTIVLISGSSPSFTDTVALAGPGGLSLPDGVRVRVVFPGGAVTGQGAAQVTASGATVGLGSGGGGSSVVRTTGWADFETVTYSGTQYWMCVGYTAAT